MPILKEVSSRFTSQIELASLFEANIFPNPIADDNFNMEMTAEAKLKYDFVLTDMNGLTLLKRNFVLQKDKTRQVNIHMNGNKTLLTGTFVGTFIFEHGSTKSYNIIKN